LAAFFRPWTGGPTASPVTTSAPPTRDSATEAVAAPAKPQPVPSTTNPPAEAGPVVRSHVTHTRGALPAAARKPVVAEEPAPAPTAAGVKAAPCAEALAALGL